MPKIQLALPRFGQKEKAQQKGENDATTALLEEIFSEQIKCHSFEVFPNIAVSTLTVNVVAPVWQICAMSRHVRNHAIGLWVESLRGCLLVQNKGTALHTATNRFRVVVTVNQSERVPAPGLQHDQMSCDLTGVTAVDKKYYLEFLYPEETLFLMERTSLVMFDATTQKLLTVHEMYNTICSQVPPAPPTDLTLSEYICYGHLRRTSKLSLLRASKSAVPNTVCGPEPKWLTFYFQMKNDLSLVKAKQQRRRCSSGEASSFEGQHPKESDPAGVLCSTFPTSQGQLAADKTNCLKGGSSNSDVNSPTLTYNSDDIKQSANKAVPTGEKQHLGCMSSIKISTVDMILFSTTLVGLQWKVLSSLMLPKAANKHRDQQLQQANDCVQRDSTSLEATTASSKQKCVKNNKSKDLSKELSKNDGIQCVYSVEKAESNVYEFLQKMSKSNILGTKRLLSLVSNNTDLAGHLLLSPMLPQVCIPSSGHDCCRVKQTSRLPEPLNDFDSF